MAQNVIERLRSIEVVGDLRPETIPGWILADARAAAVNLQLTHTGFDGDFVRPQIERLETLVRYKKIP